MRRTSMFTAAFGLGLLSLPAQAVTISLLADPSEVLSGGTVSVDIVATDFGDGEFAAAYDFSISFDPFELAFVADSFVVGSALGSVQDETLVSGADDGLLLPFVTSLLDDAALAALQSGAEVVLASFDLIARGTPVGLDAVIDLSCNSVAGPFDEGLAVLLDVTACNGASVRVAPAAIVEPGALALFALGLLGMGLVIRTHRRNKNDC